MCVINNRILPDVPVFQGGVCSGIYECGNDNIQQIYTEIDPGEIDTYIRLLEQDGFVLREESEIGKNRFLTCLGEKGLVHLSYFAHCDSMGIVTDGLGVTSYKKSEPEYEKITETTLAVMSQDYSQRDITDGNSESFVITLEDGKYVIFDGGYDYDAKRLYRFLHDNNKRADDRIVIAAWFLSHSHDDHYGAFVQFTEDYNSDITLEAIVANTGVEAMYSGGYDGYLHEKVVDVAKDIYHCEMFRPHTGQTLIFCNTEFQILYTAEDYAIYNGYGTLVSENTASLVVKMRAGGQTVLFTNDADIVVSRMLCELYGENLKCDIFQVNHHGQSGCVKRLCELADPDYTIWTTSREAFELRTAPAGVNPLPSKNQIASNVYLFEKVGAGNCFVADGKIEIITLPLRDKNTDIIYYTME